MILSVAWAPRSSREQIMGIKWAVVLWGEVLMCHAEPRVSPCSGPPLRERAL